MDGEDVFTGFGGGDAGAAGALNDIQRGKLASVHWGQRSFDFQKARVDIFQYPSGVIGERAAGKK